MKLPNNDNASISPEKITGYLLNMQHRDGKHKAAFFEKFCFEEEDVLKTALLNHAAERDIHKTTDSPYGKKYELRCEIKTPDLRNPCIVSVWIIDKGDTVPRLVTAFPS